MLCSDTAFPWNYLTIQLNRTSEDELGDPDLYGLFYGGSSGEVRTQARFSMLWHCSGFAPERWCPWHAGKAAAENNLPIRF